VFEFTTHRLRHRDWFQIFTMTSMSLAGDQVPHPHPHPTSPYLPHVPFLLLSSPLTSPSSPMNFCLLDLIKTTDASLVELVTLTLPLSPDPTTPYNSTTDNGFRIYNVDPFRETFRRVFSNGGIGIVEMLYRYPPHSAKNSYIMYTFSLSSSPSFQV
jgi:hypothetical protein